MFYFIMFNCKLLRDCSLLIRHRNGDGPRREGRCGGIGRRKGGEKMIRIYCMRKECIFNKNWECLWFNFDRLKIHQCLYSSPMSPSPVLWTPSCFASCSGTLCHWLTLSSLPCNHQTLMRYWGCISSLHKIYGIEFVYDLYTLFHIL